MFKQKKNKFFSGPFVFFIYFFNLYFLYDLIFKDGENSFFWPMIFGFIDILNQLF